MRLEGWLRATTSQAAILRDASPRPADEGSLLRMRSESVDTIGFAESLNYVLAIRRQCSHAAAIRFSLASGVRKAECADKVTFGSLVSG